MKNLISIFISIVIAQIASAQPTIDGLVKAEKDFAAYSVLNGTKDAFLKFLDSNGLVFEKGKAVNGIDKWNKAEKSTSILNWFPRYADISLSGDFGFTTGPWTYQASSKDTIIARGYYASIWHRNKNGEWKVLLDLGVSNGPVDTDTTCVRINPADHIWLEKSGTLQSATKQEKKFIQKTRRETVNGWPRKEWYSRNMSSIGILNRNNRPMAVDSDPVLGTIIRMPPVIYYKIIGSGISPGGDLAYFYGTTRINGNTENYFRIWRNEGVGWMLALEVLRY